MGKEMSREMFDGMLKNMNIVIIVIRFNSLISQEIRNLLTFSNWQDVYLQSGLDDPTGALRKEALSWMAGLAQTADDWVAVYKYSEKESHEEKLSQEKLCDEEMVSLEEWGRIHTGTYSLFGTNSDKKVRAFAELRMREIIEK